MGNILLVPSTANAALHAAFHAGLANCYTQFRGDAAVSVPEAADGVHLLVAIDVRGTPRGGFRLHLCRDTDPPPMVHALAARPEICGAVLDKGGEHLAEPRALWVHPDERGSGLGAQLTRAVIAVAPLLGANRLVILSHQYLDRYHAEVGFLIDAGMGEHAYPDPRFRSKVFWCDPVTLVGASSQARRDILRMRTLFSRQGTVSWGPVQPRRSSGGQSPGPVEKTCLITRGSIVMTKPNQQFRPFQHLVRKDQAQPLGNGIFFRETPVTAAVPTPANNELLMARDTSVTGFGRQIALYAGEQDVTALLQVAVLPAESSDFARLAAASPADLDKSALLTSLSGQERAQLAPLLYVALRRARLEDRHTVVTYVRAGATLLQDMLGLMPLTRLSPVVSPTGETYLPYGQRLDIALERAFAAAEGAGHRFPSTCGRRAGSRRSMTAR
jgi:GNAT superfamily N-acetyltransferase